MNVTSQINVGGEYQDMYSDIPLKQSTTPNQMGYRSDYKWWRSGRGFGARRSRNDSQAKKARQVALRLARKDKALAMMS